MTAMLLLTIGKKTFPPQTSSVQSFVQESFDCPVTKEQPNQQESCDVLLLGNFWSENRGLSLLAQQSITIIMCDFTTIKQLKWKGGTGPEKSQGLTV